MPFITIDQGSPAIRQYIKPKQSGTAPVSTHNSSRAIQGNAESGSQAYQQQASQEKPKRKVFQAFEIMNTPVLSLALTQLDLNTAWQLMQQHKIKHLPITENGILNAIVTEGDILKALAFKHSQSQWLQHKVYAATETTDIHQLAHVMLDEHISCLPIVDEQHALLGMVTRSDILKLTSEYGEIEFWA